MANTDISDMRKKLLEMQNELLKGSINSPESTGAAPVQPAAASVSPAQPSESELVTLLKEIRSNQHRMLQLLLEINTKIR